MGLRDHAFVQKHGPSICIMMLYGSLVLLLQGAPTFVGKLKNGHDFMPIYDESGELKGFTHPRLVEAMNKVRKWSE